MADRTTIVAVLDEIARHLELEEEGRFKARAYANAARVIERLAVPVEAFLESGAIDRTPGIGKATGAVIREVAATGESTVLRELRARTPAAVFDLMRIPGLGGRKAAQLQRELGVGSVAELEEAARAGRVRTVRGFGRRAEEKLLRSIEMLASAGERHLLVAALAFAESLREQIAALPGIEAVEVSGEVRRRLETMEGVDLCVAALDPEGALERIAALPVLSDPERAAGELRGRGRRGMRVRVRAAEPAAFAALLFAGTGAAEFVAAVAERAGARGLRLDVGGLFAGSRRVEAAGERDLFRAIGLPWVEPELRESAEWVRRRPPRTLVEPSMLRGVFHVHTTYSDGKATLWEMLDAARERQLEYVGISDHSKAAYYARGLDLDRLDAQQGEIEKYRKTFAPMKILKGTEADILADGSIDYGHEVLGRFDFVVASIHSRFGMSREEMTERVLRAIADPFVTFLGHPTGRLLLAREGYSLDFARVFDAAAEHGVIVEVNGNPHRLDLDWRRMREAVDRGVMLSINPDAHSTEEFGHLVFGCFAARKGALEPRHVFNTRPAEEVVAWLEERKARALAATGATRRGGRPGRA